MSSIHNIAFLVGWIIASGFFLISGFNHFTQLNMMTGYAKRKGIPGYTTYRDPGSIFRATAVATETQ